jgi:XRE family transcriptional regulator, regulator of sulfur utilization
MSEEQKMSIAEKLKHFRHINCLSQEKLAETSGISIRTIQRIEEGKSVGSGYTINTLAKTLNINLTDLVNSVSQNTLPVSNNISKLKILNLSAITMLVIPLANIFIPAYIYWKNRDDEKVKDIGSKIVSFQIFWTFGTLLIAIIASIILLPLFETLRAGSIPLFVPIYFISAFFNIYFVIQFAININKQLPILQKIPNIL